MFLGDCVNERVSCVAEPLPPQRTLHFLQKKRKTKREKEREPTGHVWIALTEISHAWLLAKGNNFHPKVSSTGPSAGPSAGPSVGPSVGPSACTGGRFLTHVHSSLKQQR